LNRHASSSTLFAAIVLACSALADTQTQGLTIARQGNGQGAHACMSCHGDKGQGNPAGGYPYLAGQPEEYLVKQLQDFAAGRRPGQVMAPFASALSQQDMSAVASYYAGLPLPGLQADAAAGAGSATGARLAREGKWSDGMPPCFQCHGDLGQGVAPAFPAIAGQPAAYLKKQLEYWRDGKRTNDPIGLMQFVVSSLDDSEISAVSSYLAGPARPEAK